MCSTEGTTEEKEKIQNETSEPERVKITEYRGSERTEEIQHNKRIETVLSSEILRPLQRKRESFKRAVVMKNNHKGQLSKRLVALSHLNLKGSQNLHN